MTTSPTDIDAAILGAATPSWRKVASIVARAANQIHDLPEGEAGYRLVAERISSLVAAGQLLAQGDTSQWRFSEVRLP